VCLLEVKMDSSSASATDSGGSEIAGLREAWLAAVKARDANALAQMLTDDVVVVHGNGRCVCGKEAVRADFLEGFRRFVIEQTVSPTDLIVREKWAFEISEVESQLMPIQGGQAVHARSTTIVVFSRQSDASWKVCRVLGLLE
jgi:uncharacterized protein (TIGR02246 family)